MKKRTIFQNILILCLLILVVGRMSYAKYTSEIKQETFNVEFIAGDIELTTIDSNTEFIIIPGKIITKDTKVTVKSKSEACYIFVKIEKSDAFDNYIEYELTSEWTQLNEDTNIYYSELPKIDEDRDIYIFNNNQISVKEDVTKEEYEQFDQNNLTLNFTAYAVQKTSGITSANDAWNFIDSSDNLS